MAIVNGFAFAGSAGAGGLARRLTVTFTERSVVFLSDTQRSDGLETGRLEVANGDLIKVQIGAEAGFGRSGQSGTAEQECQHEDKKLKKAHVLETFLISVLRVDGFQFEAKSVENFGEIVLIGGCLTFYFDFN